MSKLDVSSLQLSEQLGITQKTEWFVNHHICEMLKDNDARKLSGTGLARLYNIVCH